jgi:hypothetical protein
MYALRLRFDITEDEANEIIEGSKISGSRVPTVSVRLIVDPDFQTID